MHDTLTHNKRLSLSHTHTHKRLSLSHTHTHAHTHPHTNVPEVDALVVSELPVGHVAVVADDFAHVRGRHVLLLHVDEAELALLCVALRLQLLPLTRCNRYVSLSPRNTFGRDGGVCAC